MKTFTPKLRGSLLILCTILILISSFRKPEIENKYLTLISVQIIGAMAWDSKMIIINETGKVEEIDLEKAGPKNNVANALKINQTINSIAAKGYQLVSSVSEQGGVMTNYTFIKK